MEKCITVINAKHTFVLNVFNNVLAVKKKNVLIVASGNTTFEILHILMENVMIVNTYNVFYVFKTYKM